MAKGAQRVSPSSLTLGEILRQGAAHEAGHTVIGHRRGLTLVEVWIGRAEPVGDGIAVGATIFDAPNGDQNELARQRPEDMAVTLFAGSLAERSLTGRYMDEGYDKDWEILRRGLGYTEPTAAGSEPSEHVIRLLHEAKEAVAAERATIRRIADALLRHRHLRSEGLSDLLGAN